ncbi:hypothetical protein [Rhodococcus sp. 1168]|uniref:hypothetical protein n=1 Tax=Rhodococcus sp. 1168 TaxID=2018041 RepID=UPI000A0CC088|nr:hypothetical protein [Rhodococcus sp. 1168]ORI13461.1 hypothetical protein BJI47_22725 [Rhodococcus sp. 1168]
MSTIDDILILSEDRATDALTALQDTRDGTTAIIMSALAQRDAMHALTLAIVGHGTPERVPAVSVQKMAGAIRDGYRAAPSPVDHEEFIARFVLGTLGIEATA